MRGLWADLGGDVLFITGDSENLRKILEAMKAEAMRVWRKKKRSQLVVNSVAVSKHPEVAAYGKGAGGAVTNTHDGYGLQK